MPAEALIEQRLAVVEAAVVELQRRLTGGQPAPNWVDRFDGAFKDEPAFADVVEFGRALRSEDRPREGNA